MKKNIRLLRQKAIDGLVLSIEHFNRPWDQGRVQSVLILLDHAFEMLLKSAILHKGGKIRKSHDKQTIGFSRSVHIGHTDANIKFLTEQQVFVLLTINGQRNAVQHYLIDISEHQLYFYAQAGVTLFQDVHDNIFGQELVLELPERVLPISTTAPRDLIALFENEVEEIKHILTPGTRKEMNAIMKTRSLAILENSANGTYEQPTDHEIRKICKRLSNGEKWTKVFPGVASISVAENSSGPTLSLRLTKKEGIPVQIRHENEETGIPIVVRRVNELDYYSLGATGLAKKVGITVPKLTAVVKHLNLRNNPKYFKQISVGRTVHSRYSQEAISIIKDTLEQESIDDIWSSYQACKSRKNR